MPKKILFVFSGTGVDVQSSHDFFEGTKTHPGEIFQQNVIRVYFNGCHDPKIGGKIKPIGELSPDLDFVAKKIRSAFNTGDDGNTINLVELRNQFGMSIIIEPNNGLNESEEINDISLVGYSRGGVTTFSTARALNDLGIPMSILAEEPVPGDDRASSYTSESIYRKNFDLSMVHNIISATLLLGTYSKHNPLVQNKWFRQMAPKFPLTTNSHIFVVPKKNHFAFTRRIENYKYAFLFQRDLTRTQSTWNTQLDLFYPIPKVAQQKFHFGVVGRTQYLPTYKESLLQILEKTKKYPHITVQSKFKEAQALLALHNAHITESIRHQLVTAVSADTVKGKGLREFITEIDSIIQYSKTQDKLPESSHPTLMNLENNLYEKVADFQQHDLSTLEQKEAFIQEIQNLIKNTKKDLPSKIYNKLHDLSNLLLKENTLIHPHLIKFIDERETFQTDMLIADRPSYDAYVTNALALARKLFYSSEKQRSVVFKQNKASLLELITEVNDLADIVFFLKPIELKETLKIVDTLIKTLDDVLLLMRILPSYNHRKILYHAIKAKIPTMHPKLEETEQLKEFLSDKKYQEVCQALRCNTYSTKEQHENKESPANSLKP